MLPNWPNFLLQSEPYSPICNVSSFPSRRTTIIGFSLVQRGDGEWMYTYRWTLSCPLFWNLHEDDLTSGIGVPNLGYRRCFFIFSNLQRICSSSNPQRHMHTQIYSIAIGANFRYQSWVFAFVSQSWASCSFLNPSVSRSRSSSISIRVVPPAGG